MAPEGTDKVHDLPWGLAWSWGVKDPAVIGNNEFVMRLSLGDSGLEPRSRSTTAWSPAAGREG